MVIIAILAVSALGVYWLLKPKAKPGPAHKKRNTSQHAGDLHYLYQAASINAGGCACAAVEELAGKRFLAEQAPRLPLANCDSLHCQCRYVRHEDRREREDRRALYCLETDLYIVGGHEEHRAKSCRRRSDKLNAAASDLNYDEFKWAT